jgi:hypothetical protein
VRKMRHSGSVYANLTVISCKSSPRGTDSKIQQSEGNRRKGIVQYQLVSTKCHVEATLCHTYIHVIPMYRQVVMMPPMSLLQVPPEYLQVVCDELVRRCEEFATVVRRGL